MKLGIFIKKFSHNNLIRLVYKKNGGYETALDSWNDIDMDWKINEQKGKFRHYVNNEVIGLASILCLDNYPETINIVIKKLENQPFIEEKITDNNTNCSTI